MYMPGEPIAIIGTGCRFPGNANKPAALWDILTNPRDLSQSLSSRFNTRGWHHENGKYHGHCNVDRSYLLSGETTHRKFDAQFFGISAVEANSLDPQMRLLLETVYEALEAAGIPVESLRGSDTAVYSGMMTNSYKTSMERDLDNIGTYHVSETSRTIDTACSSSMIAVHQAVQQLRTGQSHVAIAAGSNLLLDPSDYVSMSKLEMLSYESRSRMWDKSANGYARGEGVAVVVLKTLSAAEADGDNIECVIRETATNQDGRTSGITMPSAAAQTKLIRDCYARAGLDPANPAHRPQYFEAHGTGTPAGDPVEAEAIKNAFFHDDGVGRGLSGHLLVGSIKTIIGHSESVAGLAGLIKTSLALQESSIPPNLLFNEINPRIAQHCKNLRVPISVTPWPAVADGSPRRACVNRSRLAFGVSFFATSVQELCEKLDSRVAASTNEQLVGTRTLTQLSRDRHRKPRVLGIFTGQGAQSSRMGAALIERSVACRQIIDKLETRLAELPKADRPSWSLKQELLRENNIDLGSAALSQPLSTALQILQIDLLKAARVDFSAVVGHSSGEIAAAYAAGMISAEDAICISYYRGLFAEFATGRSGEGGAMLAVGTSLLDAQELCNDDDFQDRVVVAAVNSSSSITLSGDKDAIEDMKVILEDEGKFVRRLKVDKAYHSHHMSACSVKYLTALEQLNVTVCKPTIPWFSSVNDGASMGQEDLTPLKVKYWNDNMVQPVVYMRAIEAAWESMGPFDMAIELGPHPALQAPSLQNIQELSAGSQDFPYTGIHTRGKDAVESFATALGLIWTHLGTVDLASYDRFLTNIPSHELTTGLPPYCWDHDKEYWHESRYTRAIRTRSEPWHELLGHLTPDSTGQDMRWRNILCPNELPWLKDHALQQQAVFPAAGYVVAAVEAAAEMARARDLSVSLVEVLDLDIGKAIAFDSDESRFETISSLSDIQHHGDRVEAVFNFNAASAFQESALTLHACGRVRVEIGQGSLEVLPKRSQTEPNLSRVDSEEFYASLLRLDYQYNGSFRALHGLQRRLGCATGYITKEPSRLLIDPAMLDAAFQSLLLAHSAPNSGGIWALHVPRSVRAIRINPLLCTAAHGDSSPAAFDCVQPEGMSSLEGDIDVFSTSSGVDHAMIQIERLKCVPFARPTAQDDKAMFTTTLWDVALPDAVKVAYDGEPSSQQVELARLLERMAVFYLRKLDCGVPQSHDARKTGPYVYYFKFASEVLSLATRGKLPLWSSEWTGDSWDDFNAAYQPHLNVPDVKLLKAIGDNIIEIATGKIQAIEVGMQDSMLTKIYESGLGFKEHTRYLARIVKQIVHRYPHMNILEVGAGTGGATKEIIREAGPKFASYTYTDISSGFFEVAQQIFTPHLPKMKFQVLDISRDIRQQGTSEHSYDLIIASAVLHATPTLRDTLENVRQLLRPGGYLVVAELHTDHLARIGAIFGALPGWWLGVNEGRTSSPCISIQEWDHLLRTTGFSGCDTVTPVRNGCVMPLSVFVSQAVDPRVDFIRRPLSSSLPLFTDTTTSARQELVLLGGCSPQTSRLIPQLMTLLSPPWRGKAIVVHSIHDIQSVSITSCTTVLSLLDLDEPVLANPSKSTWEALKWLLQEADTILWASTGRRAQKPHANMMVGLLRAARLEHPGLAVQCFDSESEHGVAAEELAEALLRLKATIGWQRQGQSDSLLASIEPEIVRGQDGTTIIPRVVESSNMNDRYNSSRRQILSDARGIASTGNLEIVGSHLQHTLDPAGDGRSTVHVTHSLKTIVRVSASSYAKLILGLDSETDAQVVALAGQESLKVVPYTQVALPQRLQSGQESAFLALLAHHMVADMFLAGLAPGSIAIVHDSGMEFATVVTQKSKERGLKIVFTTTSTSETVSPGWIAIHPKAPDRTLRRLLPTNVTALLDFNGAVEMGEFGCRLRTQLPRNCRYDTIDSYMFQDGAWKPQHTLESDAHARLSDCVARALARSPVLKLLDSTSDISGPHQGSQIADQVVDWIQLISNTPIRACPAESQMRFSDRKTYWLAGLSGGLGLLLCEWMVRHGAKYVVISSRAPRVEQAWLERMHAAGAEVKIHPWFKAEVESVYYKIRTSLPIIAGVCQGAITRPKVEGSMLLDEIFQPPTPELEFFVFFSSVGSISGRPGQSNYAAANLFMTAVAERRKRRGQAASVMHIGPIFGVGYMNQQGLDADWNASRNLKSMFPISERDFLEHFAEAVISGRSGSKSGSLETISGLAKLEPTQDIDPLLSHYTKDQLAVSIDSSSKDKSKVPLKTQLANAQGHAQVMRIIGDAFLQKLSVLFQTELSKLEKADAKTLRLDEMGIDSLLAVEIRGWFVQALQVNIPVLKILSGASVADLIDLAVETIPQELVPNLNHVESDNASTSEPTQQQTRTGSDPPSQEPSDLTATNSQRRLLVQADPVLATESHETLGTDLPKANSSSIESYPNTPRRGHQAEGMATMDSSGSLSSSDGDSLDFVSLLSASSTSPPRNGGHTQSSSWPATPQLPLSEKDGSSVSNFQPEDEKALALSFSQSLFWFSSEFSKDPRNLNLTATFRLTGDLNLDRLETAVLALGQQHESLRTRFVMKDGRPVQSIMRTPALRLERWPVSSLEVLEAYANEVHSHVYDLEHGRTVRLALASLSSTQHFFIIGVHHLAMDGQSFFPLMKDLLIHYTNDSYGPLFTNQYADFSQSQHEDLASGRFEEDLAFWKAELGSMPPALPLLRTVTPFHFYLAVFRVLLFRYTGSKHFSVGVGDANRTEESLMGSIGDFLNMLPLVFKTNGSLGFEDVLQETRTKTHEALAHSRLPFQVLLNELGVERSSSTTPIFQAFIDYRLAPGESMTWGNCLLELMSFKLSKMAYDVAVDIVDNANGDCSLTFVFRDDLYSQADAEKFANSYLSLAKDLAGQPNTMVGSAKVFDDIEIKEALGLGRGKTFFFLSFLKSSNSLTMGCPEKIAIITGDGRKVTYGEMQHGAEAIASKLQAAGITTASRVAVLQEPTPEWIFSILAVMRIGAVYLPLDVGTTWGRLAAMVRDCQPEAVLVDEHTKDNVHRLECPHIQALDVSTMKSCSEPLTSSVSATADAISTILYTSGSSGTPKGILLTHKGIRSWLEPCKMLYGLRPSGEVVLQQSSQGFDMSLMQIFTALCFGGSLCILPRRFRGDARAISEMITRYSVTHTYGTPSEYLSWLRYGDSGALRASSWKTALVGGERLTHPVVKAFATLGKHDLRFHHMYGTTESTFCAAVTELDYATEAPSNSTSDGAQPSYPAGAALPNYNIYILDEQRQPVPVGLQGEVYIGGAGVSLGYLNNAGLTAETFVPDPFASPDDLARGWTVMQRTGDLGRWSQTEPGSLLIEGRISDDTMVKLRGLRVDLQEVEHAIVRAGGGVLSEAVVSVRRDSLESPEFLIAHVVFEKTSVQASGSHDDFSRKLRSQLDLPLYMRPAFIVPLEKLPTMASGKLDRKAVSLLSLPGRETVAKDIVWTTTEERLKTVWEELLSHELVTTLNITPDTDFFHIGGSSLLLLELRDKIKSEFGVDLTLLNLFESSLLSSMAQRIRGECDTQQAIDWDEETKLRPCMKDVDSGMLQHVTESASKVVVLTGGSGYLGKALIDAMIRDPTPLIGLSRSVIERLFSRAHLIIHNGSDISYMKTYHSIRQSNFLTTKDLIEWSMPRMIPFHYVSSAGIGNFSPGVPLTETSMASVKPPTDGSMGYTACKWASEVFLEKLVKVNPHWPICVHRPTLISRDDIPQLDGMHNILWYARELGAIPKSEGLARGVVNVVGLDTVVAGVLDCALRGHADSQPGRVHFANHAGPLDLPLGDTRRWALERTADGYVDFSGTTLEEIPLHEWVRKASELGMHPIMSELLSTFGRDGEVEFPTIGRKSGSLTHALDSDGPDRVAEVVCER
ncbi:hypothetical protein KVR01_008390 [Diaporthe batatas]|uniref:uncharacterized protein n=1 Tax=Diaporthe batatas TaxID=748121 RepID=UPI001D0387C5|nr:uncharacterized protein KVR01_008390 [Diaporthe batatas]KAG8161403.1 hypothetical protein KVR01_008390 [Diaporthe batatas]